MCKGWGFTIGFVALCAFICCFGALHMLNQIVHIDEEAALAGEFQLATLASARCHRTFIVNSGAVEDAHLTWLELFYMKWTLVLTIFYTFMVMLLIRAQYMSHFDINFTTSNAMMLVGGLLSVVLVIATVILHERLPFGEMWCNEFIVGFMYFIAINIGIAVVFFLIHSCQYHFHLDQRDF
ncbi:uncharacterized protein LOC6565934 [Drosophila grimshawi]|uniref:GH24200 n=1 Tax=Drosophila grimshawi TaxID=7222 RepID=B4JN58_DROGR|nr:uncharacterized protein LOC6565934 [Drosophila grimshawi]EDV92151.1 GH24200 [Drosophila grimshawi]